MAEQRNELSDLLQQLLVLQSSQQRQSPVGAVSLKLPEFWNKLPDVWFARIEAQFNTRGITEDQTKYDYVVSTLDVNTAEEMQTLLGKINETPYETYTRSRLFYFTRAPHRLKR